MDNRIAIVVLKYPDVGWGRLGNFLIGRLLRAWWDSYLTVDSMVDGVS